MANEQGLHRRAARWSRRARAAKFISSGAVRLLVCETPDAQIPVLQVHHRALVTPDRHLSDPATKEPSLACGILWKQKGNTAMLNVTSNTWWLHLLLCRCANVPLSVRAEKWSVESASVWPSQLPQKERYLPGSSVNSGARWCSLLPDCRRGGTSAEEHPASAHLSTGTRGVVGQQTPGLS